jgi:hypothetical protein
MFPLTFSHKTLRLANRLAFKLEGQDFLIFQESFFLLDFFFETVLVSTEEFVIIQGGASSF